MSDSKVIIKYQDQVLCTYVNQPHLDYLANDVLEESSDGKVMFKDLLRLADDITNNSLGSSLYCSCKDLFPTLIVMEVLKDGINCLLELDDTLTVERWVKAQFNKAED